MREIRKNCVKGISKKISMRVTMNTGRKKEESKDYEQESECR